jgi:tRNA 2-selenouridine synthase
MALHRITAAEALAQYASFDCVIDARSESEHAEDHLPGAVNWPTLTDAERHLVGTEYKQVSPFEARKRGAALAALNIARHVQTHVMPHPRNWRPLVYCWRGGQRSGSLGLVLGEIGFTVRVVEGGYQAFRREVLAQLQTLPATLQYRVLCGPTGSAKSRLLQALAAEGAQVLDLEALACHRGSVLGPLPGQPQPSQKAFETAIWQALRGFSPSRPVFVESESRTIGRLRVPETLLVQMRAAPCVRMHMALPERVAFLLQDYAHFVTDVELFCRQLQPLIELRGAQTVQRWQALARAQSTANHAVAPQAAISTASNGPLAQVVQELLEQHYDPVYLRSMQRNYTRFDQALNLTLNDASPGSLQQHARDLINEAVAPG